MPTAKDLKTGMVVELDGAPCAVEQIQVQTPSARGANTLYKVRTRDLRQGTKLDKVFRGTEVIREADFVKRSCQFLYKDDTHYHFMDNEDYHQFSLSVEQLGEQINYLTENMAGLLVMIHNREPIGIQLPGTVEMPIECDPGVRGNSATGRTKPATLPTGLVVQVPEYLEAAEIIRVDTNTAQFVARVDPGKSF